jgi:hypothetical protein
MATTNATISLTSPDLLTDSLAFSTTSTLTQAGNATGLTLTSGLARTNFTVGGSSPFNGKTIYRANDATGNGANKVYLKNLSTTAAEYFTIFIDQEEMGRLYAGDWAFFPWSAVDGTEEVFTMTIANTWASGDTWDFDGITTTAANSTVADIAAQIHAQNYPNWTTSISTAAVTFTARVAGAAGVVTSSTAITGDTVTTAGDGTAAITSAAAGTRSESDIIVVPSVATTMDLEHMLLYQ